MFNADLFTAWVLVSYRRLRGSADSDRGDVPGWVMITVMTAGLVVAIFVAFHAKIQTAIDNAMDNVTNNTKN